MQFFKLFLTLVFILLIVSPKLVISQTSNSVDNTVSGNNNSNHSKIYHKKFIYEAELSYLNFSAFVNRKISDRSYIGFGLGIGPGVNSELNLNSLSFVILSSNKDLHLKGMYDPYSFKTFYSYHYLEKLKFEVGLKNAFSVVFKNSSDDLEFYFNSSTFFSALYGFKHIKLGAGLGLGYIYAFNEFFAYCDPIFIRFSF